MTARYWKLLNTVTSSVQCFFLVQMNSFQVYDTRRSKLVKSPQLTVAPPRISASSDTPFCRTLPTIVKED